MFDLRLDPAFQSALIIKIELNGKMTDGLQMGNVGGKEKRGSAKAEGAVEGKSPVEEVIEERNFPILREDVGSPACL
jgi:hypothetical protein